MMDDRVVKCLFEKRMRMVEKGDRRGVIGEVRGFLEDYRGENAGKIWEGMGKVKKGKMKRYVKDFLIEMEERMFYEWKQDMNDDMKYDGYNKEEWGREDYVMEKKKVRRMIAAVRLGVTNALGDKGNKGGVCRLCGMEEETAMHWVVSCSCFRGLRSKYLGVDGKEQRGMWGRFWRLDAKDANDFLGMIDSVLYLRISVRLVDEMDEVDCDELFLNDLNLRSDVWEKIRDF